MSTKPTRTAVTLIHGLWMNEFAMMPLQTRIAKCGFNVNRFRYPSMRAILDESAQQLSRFISSVDADVVHLVAHSLGGVVALRALQLHPIPKVQRVVLLGSPVSGSVSGRRLARFHLGRLMLGKSRDTWNTRPTREAPERVQVGVIAGSAPYGLGRLFGKLPEPNDGVVPASETSVINAADQIVMPINHIGLILSGNVAQQVCAFLGNAQFTRRS